MAAKRKSSKKKTVVEEEPILTTNEVVEAIIEEAPKKKKIEEQPIILDDEPKYRIGSIVYVSKNAGADLNGFKLFPQYKKYTYTVEAYDQITGVYTLRKLNLSLKLKESDIVSPDERAHDVLNRKQF